MSLTLSDGIGISMVSKMNYINVFNGVFAETTHRSGSDHYQLRGSANSRGRYLHPYPLYIEPRNSELEIQPPPESGFEDITLYARDGIGFTRNAQNQNLITGSYRSSSGFSRCFSTFGIFDTTGKFASFNYSIDLPSYPCNAKLSTTIMEGLTH